jgi:hypothetical protein
MATVFRDIVGADRGFSVGADVYARTADGADISGIWNEFQAALNLFNATRGPLVALFTHTTTDAAQSLPLDGGRVEFEVASEFGVPKAGRAEPEFFVAGYPLEWYDLALRYTTKFLRDATRAEVEAQQSAAFSASDELQFRLALRSVLTPATAASRRTNDVGAPIYSLYAGSADDAPPSFKGRSFGSGHTHYLVSGSTEIDGQDLDDVIEHVAHHGYGIGSGEQIVLVVHPNEGKKIRGFRAGVNSPYDFIPAQGGVPYITTETIVGSSPNGQFNGLDVIGQFGTALVVETYDAFAGYVIAVAHSGANSNRNVLAARSHATPAWRGLRLMPGSVSQQYPLVDATYGIGIGFGVRNRGAAAVIQIKASGQYTPPTI